MIKLNNQQHLRDLKDRVARVENGKVWGSDRPGPRVMTDEKQRSEPADEQLNDLLHILTTIKKKGELKRHCRSITIRQGDLAALILTCVSGTLPWLHRAYHRDFVPSHLKLTDDDLGALAANEVGKLQPRAQKTANKISALFDERRMLSGHMFFTPDFSEWHFFYFDQRDFSERNNHWEGGSHIHLINYLWPRRTAQEVWEQFCTGNTHMSGALHVKFQRRPGDVYRHPDPRR